MEGQLNIGPTALEAVHIQCTWRFGLGWDVRLGARQNGCSWASADQRFYDYLTTEELAQVLHQEVERLLS